MSSVFIEWKKKAEEFVATQNGRVIGHGDTQQAAIDSGAI